MNKKNISKKLELNSIEFRGNATEHYMRYTNLNAEVGEVFVIPCGKYSATQIRGSLSSKLSKLWGKKTYKTHIDGNNVKVLRVSLGVNDGI